MSVKSALKIKINGQWVAVPVLVGEGTGGEGNDGEDGGYYTPAVSSGGLLSWTPSKSDMPAVPSADIKGPKGDTGSTGATGPAGPAGSDGAPGYTPVKGTDYFTAADKQSIVNDALSALAGADPSYAGYAELKSRTNVLETKAKNMAEDIEIIQNVVDIYEIAFGVLHHPLPAPEDPEKMSFVYTSWVQNEDTSVWYDDITLMSPTGDVYAGRMIDNDPGQYVREKLATEKYVQNAMILTSPNGSRFRITVNDDGTLSTTPVT